MLKYNSSYTKTERNYPQEDMGGYEDKAMLKSYYENTVKPF